MTGIICAGNWIVDIVHTIDAWPGKSDLVLIRDETTGVGGGAANVALDLAAFATDLPIHPVGLVGTDLHGQSVITACTVAGLDTLWIAETNATPTAHTHVMNVPGDSRTFFYHPGTNDLLSEGNIPVEALAGTGARLFYLGYLNLMGGLDRIDAQGSSGAARVLARARATGMITCVDLVSVNAPTFRETVAAALPNIDYLFLNEVEAARATGLPINGESDRDGLLAAATALRKAGAATVVLHTATLSLWLDGNAALWADVAPIAPNRFVSALGAGDAFCAGVLFGLHSAWPPAASLRLGHLAAAACLTGATASEGLRPLATLMPDHPPLTGR